jgi:radical SAM superfamily enzyme YgiQ (UPF0313 family)
VVEIIKKHADICLIYVKDKFNGFLPLGISYLASTLMREGYNVQVIDTSVWNSQDEVFNEILSKPAKIYGISVMTPFFNYAKNLSMYIKNKIPGAVVIMGGAHPTVLTKETLSCRYIDYVIRGEAENTMPQFLNHFNSSPNIDGVYYLSNNEMIGSPNFNYISDLDSLPFPERDIFQIDKYLTTLKLHLLFSRGCPFNCTYCQPTLDELFGKKVRFRSPENVLEEINYLHKKYKVDVFSFVDDTLTINKNIFLRFCELLLEKNMKIKWKFNTRANTISEEMISLAARAGAQEVAVGIESGNIYVREQIYKKGITNSQVLNTFKWLNKHNIESSAFLMIGAPGETIKMVGDTIKIVKKAKPKKMQISKTTPLPGTHLYDIFKRDNLFHIYNYDKTTYAKIDYAWPTDMMTASEKNLVHYLVSLELTKKLQGALQDFLREKNGSSLKILLYLLIRKILPFRIAYFFLSKK